MIARTLALLLLAQPPVSQPVEAEAPSQETIAETADAVAQLLQRGEHEDAMRLLERVDPAAEQSALVYMRGVVEEDRGNCPAAIEHYEHYVEMDVLDVDASAALRRRDRCARLLEAARVHTVPPPAVPPGGEAVPSPDDTEPTSSTEPGPPRYADPLAISLTALGALGFGVGVGFFAQGRADEVAARQAFDLETYEERGRRAEARQRTGVALMAAAGGVVAFGVIRFVWISVARKRASAEAVDPLAVRF